MLQSPLKGLGFKLKVKLLHLLNSANLKTHFFRLVFKLLGDIWHEGIVRIWIREEGAETGEAGEQVKRGLPRPARQRLQYVQADPVDRDKT